MKSYRNILLLLSLALLSCKKPIDGHSSLPEGNMVSVQHLKTFYNGYPLHLTGDYVVKGQVLSSDMWGNFRRSIMVGDVSGAIEIKIAAQEYFLTYPVGQYVMVRCNGLTLGSYGGGLQLGTESYDGNYECGFIPSAQIPEHIVEYGLPAEEVDVPVITHAEISPRYVNCLVIFEDVQFAEPDNTWGDEEGYTDRILQFPDGGTLAVTTPPDAVFAHYPLPRGKGAIQGILGVFNGEYSLRVNTPEDHNMVN